MRRGPAGYGKHTASVCDPCVGKANAADYTPAGRKNKMEDSRAWAREQARKEEMASRPGAHVGEPFHAGGEEGNSKCCRLGPMSREQGRGATGDAAWALHA